MNKNLTQILSLPGVMVKSQKNIEKALVLEVASEEKTARCSKCQKISHRLHQNHWHLVKDLPWGETEIFLRVNRRQFKCDYCKKPFSEELNFVGKRKKYTDRYAEYITKQVVNSNLLNVAQRNNLSEAEVESMINKISQKKLPIDMKSLKSVFKKLCPKAVITADRFHVTKLLHEELNQGRIDQKKTAFELGAKEREKLFSSLRGSKYILLRREKDLKEKGKEKLEIIKESSVSLNIMHSLKEEFTDIFERSENAGEGTIKLAEWLLKAEKFFPKTVKTIKNWFAEIVGYFEQGTTQGIVEGINNRLKVIKRCGFGFTNFANFEKRALLFWHLA